MVAMSLKLKKIKFKVLFKKTSRSVLSGLKTGGEAESFYTW